MSTNEKTKAVIGEDWPTSLSLAETILVFRKQRSTPSQHGVTSGTR